MRANSVTALTKRMRGAWKEKIRQKIEKNQTKKSKKIKIVEQF